jgi:site-specific recombinase XerD
VLIDTGIRRAELVGMCWTPATPETHDLDLEQGVIRVLGKGRRERMIAVGQMASQGCWKSEVA